MGSGLVIYTGRSQVGALIPFSGFGGGDRGVEREEGHVANFLTRDEPVRGLPQLPET